MKYPVIAGIFLTLFSSLSFAQEHPGVKYQKCLAKARSEAAAKIQAECTSLRGEGAISTCNARYSVGDATISFCKLQSGVLLASQPNNLDEAKVAAEKQKAYEERIGIRDNEFVGNAYNNPGSESMADTQFGKSQVQLTAKAKTSLIFDDDGETRDGTLRPVSDRAEKAVPVPTARPDVDKAAVKSAPQETRSNPKADTTNSARALNDPKITAKSSTSANSSSTNSSRSSGGDDTAAAQAQASADISQCEQAASAANRCCGNPLSCASASDRSYAARMNADPPVSGEGMQEYCKQMRALGDGSGDLNIRLGAVCTNNHYSCSNTCSSLESKYRALMASCENCDSYSIYASAAATLASRASSCSRLSARADALSSQGLSTATNSAYGAYCQSMSTAMPSTNSPALDSGGYGGLSMRDPYGCSAYPGSPACQTCSQNANAPGCAALRSAAAQGEAGFRTAESKTKNFGIGDTTGAAQGSYQPDPTRASADSRDVNVPRVPNNAGGGFLGADSPGPARLDATGRPIKQDPARSYTTEVEQGYRSGGYTQPAQQAEVFPMSYGSQPATRAVASAPADSSGYMGMDLKQYLPGGSRDPGRRLAGATEQMQINAKEENIWRRISNKMYEKCKLGILWRCQ